MDTKQLKAPIDNQTAATLLRAGGLVALPTETVYGLGANALDPVAVSHIFTAKGRPQDNPLIVHVSCMAEVEPLTRDFTPLGKKLAEAFWPGPLTIIMKKSALVPSVVSAGLDTVGIRMPSHPVAMEVIRLAGVPIAAPSANTSGKPSPTRAAHVLDDMDGRIDAVLDGGSCDIGVESTVVDATGSRAVILRPGAITIDMMAQALGEEWVDRLDHSSLKKGQVPKAPGMKYRHYAPKAQVALVGGAPQDSYGYITAHKAPEDGVLCFSEYVMQFDGAVLDFGLSYDKKQHGHRLFSAFRELDAMGVPKIWVQCPREYGCDVAVCNRLKKSAEGVLIPASEREIVGIVGRSGSGKTYLSQSIAGNHLLIDADALYDRLFNMPCAMTEQLLTAFPEAVEQGKINRKALSRLVFTDKERLNRLNAITHQAIIAEILNQIAQSGEKLIFIDAPTLFESGLDRYCTKIIGIVASDETCLRRIEARDGIDREQAKRRLKNQKEMGFFLEYCDNIIYNE